MGTPPMIGVVLHHLSNREYKTLANPPKSILSLMFDHQSIDDKQYLAKSQCPKPTKNLSMNDN